MGKREEIESHAWTRRELKESPAIVLAGLRFVEEYTCRRVYLIEKRKEPTAVFIVEGRPILTRFKGFGVLDTTTALLTIDGDQFVAVEIGGLAKTIAALLAQPDAALIRGSWHLVE